MAATNIPINGEKPLEVKPQRVGQGVPHEFELAAGVANEMRRLARTPNEAMQTLCVALWMIHKAEGRQPDAALIDRVTRTLQLLCGSRGSA